MAEEATPAAARSGKDSTAHVRRLVERGQICAVVPHVIERLGRPIGKFERGNSGVIQHRFSGFHRGRSHPTRQQRFSFFTAGECCDLIRRRERVGHRLGREDDQQSFHRCVIRD